MSEKLWQGRFEQPTDKMVEEYTASIHFDSRLYRYDIEGSIAHCRMLADCGIISHEEASQIIQGLGEILREIERGELTLESSQEDIHMAVEQRLMQKIGEVGGKLHTARSRNDQIALDTRLYMRDVLLQCRRLLLEVMAALTDLAEKNLHVILPGFTHLQHAQPVLLAHHLMAYCEMFSRDEERMAQCYARTNVLPLGSAALAGTTFPIDMERTARYLGFPRVVRNSMDAVSDRDYLIEFCAAAALTMMHVSRLSEELVLWTTPEFDFVEISDAFCTGSSIMPQKKNPDVPELMRGKTGRVYGNLMALLTLTKGLPLTYNRDLQEDKEPVFDTADTLLATLAVLNKMLPALRFHEEKMAEAAARSFALATDVADYLVLKGVPFRKAHHVVGQLVSYCIREGKDLSECTLEEFRKFHKSLEEDIFELLDIRAAVDRRRSLGGTSTERVREALESMRAEIAVRTKAVERDVPAVP
ncbi:argininosuccinate lyase [Desulfacinum infernum DSM 9756]|uniref:Argininosuccinate lyase n=1 Tax=Desulfacinum infernum DSM 9756 TaxID=1121391 RepID=A0A1M5CK35_9BACT|nr:argininosuccinate lyase [Desulfacinum infernum]SHF55056.1 argininosuccinate lyase [Desulfacinum infernum DSM 9756]